MPKYVNLSIGILLVILGLCILFTGGVLWVALFDFVVGGTNLWIYYEAVS